MSLRFVQHRNKEKDSQALLEIIQALAVRKQEKRVRESAKIVKRVSKKVIKNVERKVMKQIGGSVLLTIKRVLLQIAGGPEQMFEYLKQFDGGIVVTYNGFRRALEKCDIFMSPADCKEAFSELDLDDSGGITYEEFIQRMFGKVVSTTVTDSQTTVTAVKRLHSNVERKIRNLKGSPSKVFYQFRMLGGAGGNGISLKHFTLALQKMGIRAEVNLAKALFESLVNGAMLITYKIFVAKRCCKH